MSKAGKAFAIVAGAGTGTGAAVARRFSRSYPVVLLARKETSYADTLKEIVDNGGKAIGVTCDVTQESSVKAMIDKVQQEYGNDATCAAAIYQASGGFVKKPFLEMPLDALDQSWNVTVKGAAIFSQAILPLLLRHFEDKSSEHPPTLIFTGATASIVANAQVASFAAPKWALRALSQSLAKEFGPKGVHVSHLIVDGAIDIPKSQEMLKNVDHYARIGPEDIAESYWHLHTQTARGFTAEMDIRGMLEKW